MLNFEKWNLYNIYEKIKCTFPTPTPLLFYNKSKGGSNIYKKLQTRKAQLDLLIKDTKNKLTNLPEGKLICCGNQFYRSDGHSKTYIKKQDQILAEELAAKKYLSALLEDLEKEKCATDMYLRHYPKNSKVDNIYSLPNSFQRLLSSHFSPLSKELDEWMKSPYPTNPKHPEHLSIKIGSSVSFRTILIIQDCTLTLLPTISYCNDHTLCVLSSLFYYLFLPRIRYSNHLLQHFL